MRHRRGSEVRVVRARPPDSRPVRPTTHPRGNPMADAGAVREAMARLERVLGH
jgi:hypothetical protein